MQREELKKKLCETVDRRREQIISIGEQIMKCQGSILKYPLKKKDEDREPLLFANPASSYRNRVNLTVRLSFDDGATWPVARTVHPGPSAYCCLTVLQDGTVGLLYECGDEEPYEGISFARFSLDWLSG